MTGLIYKDLCNLKKYVRQLLMIVAVITIIFAMQGNASIGFLSSYTVLLCTMVVISSMSYDDYAKWDKYAFSMPISRKTLVGSKYLLGVLCGIAGSALSVILCIAAQLISKKNETPMLELFAIIGVMFCICLLILAIMLPLLFKFGAEKARMMILLVILIPTGVGIVLSQAGIQAPSEETVIRLLWATPFAAAIAFTASFFLSVRIVTHKEY